jgi:serine/threonine protein kinase
MHRNDIIHRDIKPDNILLMDRHNLKICITDLGFACKTDDYKEINLKCGTPGYVAPEVLCGHPFIPKCDIFSIGSLFFNILTGRNLYQGANVRDILHANQFFNPIPLVLSSLHGVSNECKDLLILMLQPNP